jgi:hypothetical protein
VNLTGGFHWHWQAWRAGQRWQQTSAEIEQWLIAQPVCTPQLLLIGASAGWMMSTQWLCQFQSVHTWDIDPMAATLFKLRHGRTLRAHQVDLQCHTGDGLTQLPMLLGEQPDATIFLDNVLGQIRFQNVTLKQTENRLLTITSALQGRHWGSLHDRMSGPVSHPWPNHALPTAQVLDLNDLAEPEATQRWLSQMAAQSPWLDHLTGIVFKEGTQIINFAWPMQEKYWHWLQAGWITP